MMTSSTSNVLVGIDEQFPEFFGRVRFDPDTRKGSVLDVIHIMGVPQKKSNGILNSITESYPELGSRFERIRIDSKGRLTPVAAFRDLIQLIQVLPGKTAAAFRVKGANFLCRLLAGDRTLIPQIIATAENINEETRDTLLQAVPVPMPELSNVEKRCREKHLLIDVQERNFSFQVKKLKFMEEMFGLDDRDKLYYKDVLKKSDDAGYAAIQDTDDVRGREISIALLCQEIGVNPRGKSPQIGRLMAKKWREAHPGEEMVKRDTQYNGRPYKENVYYQRDYDMLTEVVREIMEK